MKKNIVIILALTLVACVCEMRANELVKLSPKFETAPIYFESIKVVETFNDDGGWVSCVAQYALKVNDARVLDSLGYGDLPFEYYSDTKIDFSDVKVTNRSSAERAYSPAVAIRDANTDCKIYKQSKIAVLSLPAIRRGDLVEFTVSHSSLEVADAPVNFFASFKVDFLESELRSIPVRFRQLEVEGTSVTAKVLDTANSRIVETANQQWTCRDYMPSEELPPLGILISNVSIGELADYERSEYELYRSGVTVNCTQIRKMFSQGPACSDSVDSKVDAVIKFIHETVRYRSSQITPKSIADVLETGCGDCDDLAQVAAHLLREMGVDAGIAVVNVDLPDLDPQCPVGFDHAVLWYRKNSKSETKFAELTDPYDSSSNWIEGRTALVLRDSSYEVVTIADETSKIKTNLEYRDGSFIGRNVITGEIAGRIRSTLVESNDKRQAILELFELTDDELITYSVDGLDGFGGLTIHSRTKRPYVFLSELNFDDNAKLDFRLTNIDIGAGDVIGKSFRTVFGVLRYSSSASRYSFQMVLNGEEVDAMAEAELPRQRKILLDVCAPVNDFVDKKLLAANGS